MTVYHAPHLFGKYLDPLVAIGLGTVSYYIYEKRHRSNNHPLLLNKSTKFSIKD